MSSQSIKSDLLLLLAALIWGFAFVAQRVGMEYMGPFTFNAVRFALGCLVLIPLIIYRKKKGSDQKLLQGSVNRLFFFFLSLLLGIILFAGTSLQQTGMVYTTAGNGGFITGLYVVFVPILGLFIGQKTGIPLWIGAMLAVAGLYFLSVGKNFTINKGDVFVFCCAIVWAFHVLYVGWLSPRTDPIKLSVIQYAICSFLSFIAAFLFENISMNAILNGIWPVLYGGLLSVGIAYTIQVVAQQTAHPSYVSIILSMESLFAAIGGWLLLSEPLTGRGIAGGLLMLSGMIIAQVKRKGRQKEKN